MTFTPYPPFNTHPSIALLAFFTHALSEDTLVELSLKKLSLKKVSLRQLSSWGLFFGIFILEGGLLTRIFFQDA